MQKSRRLIRINAGVSIAERPKAGLFERGDGAAKVCGELGDVELKAGVEGTELRELGARFIEA
ncbi:MAG TPA: hypothetical protein VIZ32_21440, partial [Vicinamibacterales bacterium]